MILKNLKDRVERFWERNTISIAIATLILIFIITLLWDRIFISIDSGQQGVRWSRFSGTQLDEQRKEGLHIIFPWDRMYIYSTRIQSRENTLEILTEEGLTINVDYTFRFYPLKDSIPVLHKKLGPEYGSQYVFPEVEAASMSIIGNYTPEQLYQISTLVIQSSIEYFLNKQLLAQNIILEDYFIRKIKLPEAVSKSIEQKTVKEQLSFEYDYRIDVARKEKERKKLEAEGIKAFEEISGIPILKWKGLEVTSEFASSENSKIIIMGNGENSLPLLLNSDDSKRSTTK